MNAKQKAALKKKRQIDLLVASLGRHLLRARWEAKLLRWQAAPKKANGNHVACMLERVRQRCYRQTLGLPLAPLRGVGQCAACGKKPTKRKRTALLYRQEYVAACKGECAAKLEREPSVRVFKRGGAYYVYP